MSVIIVGAGMAGLTAALRLEQNGVRTLVLDKGRAPGGRMATRRVGDATYDHGAQHFSARSAEFLKQTTTWIDQGLVGEWFSSPSQTVAGRPAEPRHVGRAGMRRIPEHIGAGLRVVTSVTVERIGQMPGGVVAVSSEGEAFRGQAMVLTPPVPQIVQIFARSDVTSLSSDVQRLSEIEYDACLAVMARLDRPAGLPDGHVAPSQGPIAWLADNQHKGVSPVPAVTVHSSAEYAKDNLEADPESWVAELVEAARPHLAGSVINAQGHRWRYSQPRQTLDTGAIHAGSGLPIVLAGEVFAGARVEGAFRSGLAAAQLVEKLL